MDRDLLCVKPPRKIYFLTPPTARRCRKMYVERMVVFFFGITACRAEFSLCKCVRPERIERIYLQFLFHPRIIKIVLLLMRCPFVLATSPCASNCRAEKKMYTIFIRAAAVAAAKELLLRANGWKEKNFERCGRIV